jgi:hypothetical protein
MLSVTTYLSTNIAPVPLLWVLPLSIYLLTLILVFARKTLVPHSFVVRIFPMLALPVSIVIILQATQPIGLMVVIHLISLFVISMVCHGVVANDRPATTHLTEFYLWVSFGGVLGGIFNAFPMAAHFTAGKAWTPLVNASRSPTITPRALWDSCLLLSRVGQRSGEWPLSVWVRDPLPLIEGQVRNGLFTKSIPLWCSWLATLAFSPI